MPWKATIAGVDVTNHIQTAQPVQITQLLNERATAQFRCKPGVSPNRFDPVVLYADDGVTPLFGGLVTNRTIVGIQTKDRQEPYSTDVQCGDYFTYLDWAYLNVTYTAAVTVKQILTDLIAALPSSSGVTLNPAQVDGPPVQPFTWAQMRASDALRDLSQRTGFVALMSPTKVLTMFAPGTTNAPFTITDAAPHCQTITWTDNPYVPANDAAAVCGPTGQAVSTQGWTVGAPSTWQVDIQAVVGGWTQGYVSENGAVNHTVSGPGGGGYYEFDATVGRGTLSVGAGVKPSAGTVLSFAYTASFPFTVHATTGATPVIQFQESYPNVTDYSQGQELAQGLLAQLNQQPRDLTVTSLDTGWAPGHALTVNLTARLNSAFVITSVTLTLMARKGPTAHWVASVLATESDTYQGSYLDQWRALTGTASASGGIASTPPVTTGGGVGGSGGGIGTAPGSGTPNRIVKWTTGPALADSVLFEAGGNIGLNTTTPGTFQGGGGSTGTVFQVQSATSHAQFVASAHNPGALAAMNFEVGDATSGRRVIQQFYHGPTNALRWRVLNETNGAVVLSDVLALTNTGNVGIGTATPVAPLDVVGRLRLTGAPSVLPTSGVGIEMSYDSTNAIGKLLAYDRTGGAYKPMTVEGNPLGLNVQSGANVGIGTATPSYRLHVVSSGGGVISQVQGVTNPRFNVSDGAVTADVYVVSGSAQFGSVTTTPVNINTNDTVAIHVDTSQRVGLGTTAPLTFQLELTADVGPHTPFSGNIGHLTQKWASVYAGELHVETLVAQQTITTIGGRAVIASGGNVVTALVGVSDGFIFFKYNSLQTGDVIVFEGPDATGAYSTEFMQVIGAPTGAGPFLYQVTRNYGGAFTAHSWPAGAACMNTGQTGAGFIDLYSINSLKGPSEVGPTIVGNLRTSNAYNDWKPRWAIGNLNGLYGYTTNLFGVAIGVPAGTNITIEASNGILIRTGTVPVFSVDTAGNMRLSGNLTMSTNGIFSAGAATTFAAGTGWWLDYNSGTPRFRVGNPSGDQIAWDGVNLSVRASNLTVDTTGVTVAVTTAYQAARAYRFSTGFGSTNNFGLFGLETGTTRQLTLQNTTGVGNNVYVSLLAQNGNGYFAQLNLVAASTSTSAALQSSYIQLVGNVGVNTQTASSVPLTVYNLATGWAMAITAGVFNGAGLYIAAGQSSQEIIQAWFQANVTTLQGIVYGDGNWLKNNTSVWSILSDRTIKKNVVPLTGALDRIRRVQLHEFEYNGVAGTLTDEHGVGVIAQDIQPIFPRSVTTVQIPNIHNPLLKTTALGFNAHELFMNGIGAIIELDQRVAALTARLAAIEQR